jgi:hypothetical protein
MRSNANFSPKRSRSSHAHGKLSEKVKQLAQTFQRLFLSDLRGQ